MSKQAFISRPHLKLTATVINTFIFQEYLHGMRIIPVESTRSTHVFRTDCNYHLERSLIPLMTISPKILRLAPLITSLTYLFL